MSSLFEQQRSVLMNEMGFSAQKTDEILGDPAHPWWESIATGSISLTTEQLSILFSSLEKDVGEPMLVK